MPAHATTSCSKSIFDWARDGSIDLHLTVDVPVQGWPGEVGFVTEPLRRLSVRPDRTTAFLCGPEPMMRNAAKELLRKRLVANRIRVSLGTKHAMRYRLVRLTASSGRCCCAETVP